MRTPKHQPRDRTHMAETLDSALTACTVVLLLASLGGLMGLFASLHVGLRVGDILVFKPEARVALDMPVTAQRPNSLPGKLPATTTCTLNPAVMASGNGGSIVVETKSLVDPFYGVHWSGGRTSLDGADCGRVADLTLSRLDLQTLVNAIGGFSLNSRGFVF